MGALIDAGVKRAVGLVLAPHYSPLSVGEYISRATAAGDDRLSFTFVRDWHLEPSYIALLADRVRETTRARAGEAGGDPEVVFTAHSLPSRILDSDDPYPRQLLETAEAVAAELGPTRWSIAWQSAGRTSEQSL